MTPFMFTLKWLRCLSRCSFRLKCISIWQFTLMLHYHYKVELAIKLSVAKQTKHFNSMYLHRRQLSTQDQSSWSCLKNYLNVVSAQMHIHNGIQNTFKHFCVSPRCFYVFWMNGAAESKILSQNEPSCFNEENSWKQGNYLTASQYQFIKLSAFKRRIK